MNKEIRTKNSWMEVELDKNSPSTRLTCVLESLSQPTCFPTQADTDILILLHSQLPCFLSVFFCIFNRLHVVPPLLDALLPPCLMHVLWLPRGHEFEPIPACQHQNSTIIFKISGFRFSFCVFPIFSWFSFISFYINWLVLY